MTTPHPRPLSPHLQIYRPQLTSVMSILHRVTGAALAVGLLMLAWGLAAAALGSDAWAVFSGFCATGLGQIMLVGWSVALFYHSFNGIRHLVWDTVHLFEIRNAYAAGFVVLAATALASVWFWWSIWS